MDHGYTSYSAHELAADASFIQYARQTDDSAVRQWSHWLNQHPEKKEEVELALKIVRALNFKEPDFAGQDVLWRRIQSSVLTAKPAGTTPIKRIGYSWRWAAAAAILVLVGLFTYLNFQPVKIKTLPGQTLVYALPDASVIRLNAGSEVSFKRFGFKEKRHLNLSGEAFFEVEKGKDFTVETNLGQIQVLGTSFNVYARNQKLAVNCHTGKVQVTSTIGQTMILKAGQQAVVRHQALQGSDFDLAAGDWREGVFYYEAEEVGQVLEEIGRQFEVTINTPAEVARRSFTGFFNKTNLDSALYTVCWPLKLEYRIMAKTVEIKSRVN